jgi:prephenate dehydratase
MPQNDKRKAEENASTKPKRVSIQGYEGSFHQEAARRFFGNDVEVLPCDTFREVVRLASSRSDSDGGVMAIENSIAGSILPNYGLLARSNLLIIGEVYLQIRQHLLVNPGVGLEDIREVHSHPMALQQCIDFLDRHRWKLVETEDTALSAKRIRQHKSRHTAAIAGRLAAELFGLHILAPNIHTMRKNHTRFLILQKRQEAVGNPEADKASIRFSTDHSRGSLARVLTWIADGGINLSKLQSMPIPGSDFKYSFHADLEFDGLARFNDVLKGIQRMTDEVIVLGTYRRGILK